MDETPAAVTEDITRFAPNELRRLMALRTADRQSDDATFGRFTGVVLFADISGFTRLTARLAASGPDGVEELTTIINAYFTQLIDIILEYDGDILKFAGDALLTVWRPQNESTVPDCVHSALACGLTAQQRLRDWQSPAGDRLTLRIGVGSGEVHSALVGGVFNRWEFLAFGQGLIEATTAATRIEPTQIAVGPTAWQHVRGSVQTTPLTNGYHRLQGLENPASFESNDHSTLAADAAVSLQGSELLPFLPAAIRNRLKAGQSEWLTELRRLSVLFIALPELDIHTPHALFQEVIRGIQAALYLFEGSVNKLSVDEKGIVLIAAFGLPPLAHEDDPLRAVQSALEIRDRVKQLGLRVAIGITSGRVYCGTIGSQRRCEYTIMGERVNLSARLTQAAGDNILCDRATWEATRQRVRFQVLAPIALKGLAAPTPVFQPERGTPDELPSQNSEPLFGRDDELATLRAAQTHLTAGRRTRVIILEGTAGIGKSRLMESAGETATEQGINTLIGRADRLDRSTPYFAWREVFRKLPGLDVEKLNADNCPPTELQSRVRKSLQRILAGNAFAEPVSATGDTTVIGIQETAVVTAQAESDLLFPLLGSVIPDAELKDNEFTSQLSEEARVTMTEEFFTRLLTAAADRTGLQIVLEDVHWMDSASWNLARAVAESVPNVLMILVKRPTAVATEREYQRIRDLPATTQLSLQPLTAIAVEQLVSHLLEVDNLPAEITELIYSRSQGNPHFARELALTIRDARVLEIDGRSCRLQKDFTLDSLTLPDTVQGVVTRRIDRLEADQQIVLKVASVFGRSFQTMTLNDVFPLPEKRGQLSTHLQSLARIEMLNATESTGSECSFRQILTQEVAYGLLPPTQRRKLHRSIAEWYETRYSADTGQHVEVLAKHWYHSDSPEDAVDYLEGAAIKALREYANAESIRFFQQALATQKIPDDNAARKLADNRRATWQRQLAQACYNMHELHRSRDHFREALILLRWPFPENTVNKLYQLTKQLARQTLHRLLPSLFVRKQYRDSLRHLEAARAYERLAQIFYLDNDLIGTVHSAFKALNLAESLGPSAELARCYANGVVVTGLMGLHRTARAHTVRAREVAEKVQQFSCTAYVDFIRGVYWVTVGEWETAQADLTNAMEIAERIGESRRWAESAFTLANVLSRAGNLQESLQLSRRITEHGRAERSPQVIVWGLSWEAWCLTILDEDAERQHLLADELQQALRDDMPVADQILGHALLAWLVRKIPEQQALCLQSIETAFEIIAGTSQVSHYLLPAYSALAELTIDKAAAATGDERNRWTQSARKACGLLRAFQGMYPIGRPRYELHRGQLARRVDGKNAAKRWRTALHHAEHFRMPVETACIQQELASRK